MRGQKSISKSSNALYVIDGVPTYTSAREGGTEFDSRGSMDPVADINPEDIESICCVTAQHREMLDSVLEVFSLKPDWDLDIMTPRQTLSTITSKCLTGMDEAIDALAPHMVLVHGDTSTTFAGGPLRLLPQGPGGAMWRRGCAPMTSTPPTRRR